MSFIRTISSNSSISSTRTASAQLNDPSNMLYNDAEHYKSIFKSDSRFFDTSLHLYKSYQKMGYTALENDKRKKPPLVSSSNKSKVRSNGMNSLWRTRQPGFSSNHNINETPTGTLLKNHDSFKSNRADLSSLKGNNSTTRTKPPVAVYPKRHMSSRDDAASDESFNDLDIIVTRL